MSLFNRTKLDPGVRAELQQAVRAELGREPGRILATARNSDGWCVLLSDAIATLVSGRWVVIPWHLIERGGWNAQNSSLNWELRGGRRGSVVLERPGRLPEVFREQVEASIVVQKHFPIEGTREGATISAHRDLGDDRAPLDWRIRRGRGTPDTPEIRAALEQAMAGLRADYDI